MDDMYRKSKRKKKKVKKPKRKLTAAEKRAKKERRKKYRWIFTNGKQVRVKREPTIDGIPQDEWVLNNADPIWLVQNEMWEYIDPEYFDPPANDPAANSQPDEPQPGNADQIDNDIPF